VISNGDKTYRKLFIAPMGKGVEMSSTNLKFDATKIEYGTEEGARKFAPKNAEVCERLNNGEKFAFLCDQYGQFHGEEFNPFYSFIVMMDETIIPLPVFLVAADAPTTTFDWYETTEEEVDAYLREHFGDQYTTFVSEREDVRSRQLVKVEDGDVEIITEFNVWNSPEQAQGVPEYHPNRYDYLVDEKHVNFKWLQERVAQDDAPEYLVIVRGNDHEYQYDLKSIKSAFRS